MQKVFDKMCLLMAANALAAHPGHNKQFKVYTDNSDFQLGPCIIQEWRPVPTSHLSWQHLSKTIPPWKKNCFPLLQLMKTFELHSLVWTFIFLQIIKFGRLILSKRNKYYAVIQKLKSFHPPYATSRAPTIYLANNLLRLHHLVTPVQIGVGKKLVEPQRFLIRKKIKRISWIKNTLVFMMMMSKNVLSVISTYLTPHIRMRICWIMHTFINCSNQTNNCLLYK